MTWQAAHPGATPVTLTGVWTPLSSWSRPRLLFCGRCLLSVEALSGLGCCRFGAKSKVLCFYSIIGRKLKKICLRFTVERRALSVGVMLPLYPKTKLSCFYFSF